MKSSIGPWIVSSLALIVAIVALVLPLFRDPLGSGLDSYDFSTPKAAMESRLKIRLNHDIRAQFELEKKLEGKRRQEELDTLEVKKQAEFRGRKILFVTYKQEDVSKYEVQSYEKHADSGFWVRSHVNEFEVEKEDKELAAQMRSWRKSGELDSKAPDDEKRGP